MKPLQPITKDETPTVVPHGDLETEVAGTGQVTAIDDSLNDLLEHHEFMEASVRRTADTLQLGLDISEAMMEFNDDDVNKARRAILLACAKAWTMLVTAEAKTE